MAEDLPRTRSLTAADRVMVQGSWISYLRRILWIVGGVGVVGLALAIRSRLPWQVLLIWASVLFLVCWVLYGLLNRISDDLEAGIAEEITGSVRKEERGILGPESIRFIWQRLTKSSYFGIRAVGGFSLVLVAPHLCEIVYVDLDTYASIGEDELVKAFVLPHSRLAVSVRHASIAGD